MQIQVGSPWTAPQQLQQKWRSCYKLSMFKHVSVVFQHLSAVFQQLFFKLSSEPPGLSRLRAESSPRTWSVILDHARATSLCPGRWIRTPKSSRWSFGHLVILHHPNRSGTPWYTQEKSQFHKPQVLGDDGWFVIFMIGFRTCHPFKWLQIQTCPVTIFGNWPTYLRHR